MLKRHEQRRKPKGGYTLALVPRTAAQIIAEGELNRFYIRGVCRAAIDDGSEEVVVYRAKWVENPRHESLALIGKRVSAGALLDDLRIHSSEEPMLGVPGGPNSGISVHRVGYITGSGSQ